MEHCGVEAVMGSFHYIKSGKKAWIRTMAAVDAWEHECFRYLDSGVFTLLRKSGGVRAKISGAPNMKQDKDTKISVVTEEQYVAHYQEYAAFLKEHADEWDYIVEMDVDTLMILPKGKKLTGDYDKDSNILRSGVDATRWARKKLRALVGDKLMPVWHANPHDGRQERFKEIASEFPYIGIGSDVSAREPELKYLCAEAHRQGVLVHALGSSRRDVLRNTPFDTADSTTWLSSVRYAQYDGVFLTLGKGKNKLGAQAKARARAMVADIHKRLPEIDTDILFTEGATQVEKYIVAITYLQARQVDAQRSTTRVDRLARGGLFD
jgi:hypothetical protein